MVDELPMVSEIVALAGVVGCRRVVRAEAGLVETTRFLVASLGRIE